MFHRNAVNEMTKKHGKEQNDCHAAVPYPTLPVYGKWHNVPKSHQRVKKIAKRTDYRKSITGSVPF